MLVEFIKANRAELISRARAKVAERQAPTPTEAELESGVPLFLDQLIETLQFASTSISQTMKLTATARGAAMSTHGYTVAQVVHDYGDICQVVTELASEADAQITADEFHTMSLALDNAIADAVTEFTRLDARSSIEGETERSGVFAHEMRNRISAVQLAFLAIESGRAPLRGGVATIVKRNLFGMTALIDRALLEVRVDSGRTHPQRVLLHRLIEEAEVDGMMAAGVHRVALTVEPVDHAIEIEVDPQILAGALANLLQNAFKFTEVNGHVTLRTSVVGPRVEIEIEDECGGLPRGKETELFRAFEQHGANRKGLGLGLFISRKGVEASGGTIRVRDLPGKGCAFTIALPMVSSSV